MALLFLESSANLSDASAYRTTLGANLNPFSTTELSLSSTRTISFTPSATEDMRGVVICLANSGLVSATKDVTVTLKEGVTTRASKTLTASAIANGAESANGKWTVYFEFTAPYTVTTAPATWTIEITNSGAPSVNWSIRTSNGTAPFFVAVGTTLVSYTDNTDQIVVGDCSLTFDTNFTLKGSVSHSTGDSTRSICMVLCKKTSPLPSGEANLLWNTSSSITGNIDGYLVMCAHSGVRFGTSASPISVANKGILNVIAATTGTATLTGFRFVTDATNTNGRYMLEIYGEIPSNRSATIGSNASTGAGSITTTETTGWVSGDRIYIGGFTTKGTGSATFHTVSSSAGTTVNFSPNLDSSNRIAGNKIVKLNGYGFELIGPAASTVLNLVNSPSIFKVSGVRHQYFAWSHSVQLSTESDAFLDGNIEILSSSFESVNTGSGGTALTSVFLPAGLATVIDNCHFANVTPFTMSGTAGSSFTYSFINNISLRGGTNNASFPTMAANGIPTFENNVFEMANQQGNIQGFGGTFKNNTMWGNSAGNGAFFVATCANMEWEGNVFNNCAVGYKFQLVSVGCVDTDSVFGNIVPQTTSDIEFLSGSYVQHLLVNPSFATGVATAGASTVAGSAQGSHLRIANYNGTSHDDRGHLTYGEFQRTGTGLSDTTARSVYALRLKSTSSINLLNWPNLNSDRSVPTGDIQNKTMTVKIWVNINNTNFYAGTHTNPTLNVLYDGTTIITDVADDATGWQLLSVTFSPTTTTSKIEVWMSMMTDATGSDAYVYLDDIGILYPSGYSLNLGSMDQWSSGTPEWPPIANVPLAGSVWDEQTSAHTDTGSFGEQATRTEIKVDDNQALILSK